MQGEAERGREFSGRSETREQGGCGNCCMPVQEMGFEWARRKGVRRKYRLGCRYGIIVSCSTRGIDG
jgi:hypothetical protein